MLEPSAVCGERMSLIHQPTPGRYVRNRTGFFSIAASFLHLHLQFRRCPRIKGGPGEATEGRSPTLEPSAVCGERLSPIRRMRRGDLSVVGTGLKGSHLHRFGRGNASPVLVPDDTTA